MCFNKAGRGPGVPVGPGRSLGPSGQGSLRNPSKLRENIVFYILENHFLLFCRANHPIIVKGWLNFGALVGYPLCAIVWLHFLIQILIRKPVLFWWHFFQKLKHLMFVHSKFHLMFFIFPLVAFMFPQISSYFLQFYLSSFIFLFKIKKLSVFWKIVINILGGFWIP